MSKVQPSNMDLSLDKGILTIRIDTTKAPVPSSTGKMQLIATSRGNYSLKGLGLDGVSLGLNLMTKSAMSGVIKGHERMVKDVMEKTGCDEVTAKAQVKAMMEAYLQSQTEAEKAHEEMEEGEDSTPTPSLIQLVNR